MKDPRTSPEEYSDGYSYRRSHLWKCLDLDEGYADVISFFCPTTPDYVTFPPEWRDTYNKGKPTKPVKGQVFTPPEGDFEVVYDLGKAMNLVVDKLFTKKLIKGIRCTPRKEFLEMKEYETYMWISLLEYLRQCKREGEEVILLSKKELKLISPPESKTKKRDKILSRKLIPY